MRYGAIRYIRVIAVHALRGRWREGLMAAQRTRAYRRGDAHHCQRTTFAFLLRRRCREVDHGRAVRG